MFEGFPSVLSYGEPGGIRTPDPRLRRALLYPAELQTHFARTHSILAYIRAFCQHFIEKY